MNASTGRPISAQARKVSVPKDDGSDDEVSDLDADSMSETSSLDEDGRVGPRRKVSAQSDADGQERNRNHDRENGERMEEEQTAEKKQGEVALGCLLTSVIILQEFSLEVAALVEARAGLFGELKFF